MSKFTAPTADQLSKFEQEYQAPTSKFREPTKEELNTLSNESSSPMLEEDGILRSGADLGIGIVNGLTASGVDEVYGGLRAAIEKGGEVIGASDSTPESLVDKARRYQQSAQKETEEAEKRSPFLLF